MVDQKEATNILYELSNKIASGLKLTAKKDYVMPSEIKVSPLTLAPYVVDFLDASNRAPICIGREISDDDIMPGIYLNVLEGIPGQKNVQTFLNDVHSQICYLKQIHPQLRVGLLLYGSDSIPREVAIPNSSIKTGAIDFIEVVGHIWNKEDKLSSVLEDLIQEQIKASESIARVIFGKDKFHSFRGNTIR